MTGRKPELIPLGILIFSVVEKLWIFDFVLVKASRR